VADFGFVELGKLISPRRVANEALGFRAVVFFAPVAFLFERGGGFQTAHATLLFGHTMLDTPPTIMAVIQAGVVACVIAMRRLGNFDRRIFARRLATTGCHYGQGQHARYRASLE
jgi:hypothetical protein